jgi:phenylalanyl-tRNA synthetase beta chain
VLSWILTNSSTLQRSHAQGPALRISNPLTEEFSVIRPWIYPNLIEILSRSKSQPLPIYLYEIGPVLEPSKGPSSSTSLDFVQSEHFAAISMHPKSSFSEAWSHLQGIAQAIGAKLVLKEEDLDGFIGGRCAKILLPNQIQANSSHPNSKPSNSSNYIDIGIIGELHPVVLEAFGLEQPVALFELRAKDFVKKGK